jgi:hemerythrin-like domain-containing protein
MADPVAAWHEEHQHFGTLLSLLQKEVDVFHAGGPPDYRLMLDIISYLRDYGDTSHHPREDEAFRRLARRNPERELPLARLKQEHVVIAHAGEKLAGLLEQAVNGFVTPRSDIEAAAATYLVYYLNHLAREEQDVLPRAARELTGADWQAVRRAAAERQEPLFGEQAEERFRELRRRIMAAAG